MRVGVGQGAHGWDNEERRGWQGNENEMIGLVWASHVWEQGFRRRGRKPWELTEEEDNPNHWQSCFLSS